MPQPVTIVLKEKVLHGVMEIVDGHMGHIADLAYLNPLVVVVTTNHHHNVKLGRIMVIAAVLLNTTAT